MKEIKIVKDNEKDIEMFKTFEPMEQFIYSSGINHNFFAIKIDDDCVALVNVRGKFFVAKVYKNCLSIGSGLVFELGSIEEVIEKKDWILKGIK